jgi:hypothetical protein
LPLLPPADKRLQIFWVEPPPVLLQHDDRQLAGPYQGQEIVLADRERLFGLPPRQQQPGTIIVPTASNSVVFFVQ